MHHDLGDAVVRLRTKQAVQKQIRPAGVEITHHSVRRSRVLQPPTVAGRERREQPLLDESAVRQQTNGVSGRQELPTRVASDADERNAMAASRGDDALENSG